MLAAAGCSVHAGRSKSGGLIKNMPAQRQIGCSLSSSLPVWTRQCYNIGEQGHRQLEGAEEEEKFSKKIISELITKSVTLIYKYNTSIFQQTHTALHT